MRRAVFSFFTFRTSGDYSWWDDFPRAISGILKEKEVDHLCFYRGHTSRSPYPDIKSHINK
jgi:hypothetical protein